MSRVGFLGALVAGAGYSGDACTQLTDRDVSRLEAYAAAHFKVPGGVAVVKSEVRPFPHDKCTLKVPLTGRNPDVPFHQIVMLSPDHRFFGPELLDLSEDPDDAEASARQELIDDLNRGQLPTLGGKTGSVQIVIFSDFQCPYCGALNEMMRTEVLPKVGGDVVVKFRNLPMRSHLWAGEAAVVGACIAEQGDELFWKFTDAVFSKQGHISESQQPMQELKRLATELPGFDGPRFQACRDTKRGDEVLARDKDLALRNAVAATPTIFVNDIKIEGLPIADRLVATIRAEARQVRLPRK